MSVAVLVDTASSLPRSIADEHDITLVPMTVIIDGNPRRDDEIAVDDVLTAMAAAEVSTAGPNAGEFATAIEAALARADEVVVLTISQEMSGTCAAAKAAAGTLGERVRVIDTRTAAGAEGLVALAAARAAAATGSADEVQRIADHVIERVHLVATLTNLDHLVRSGRVPNIAGSAARTLHVNPLFEFRDGAAHSLHPAIGEQAARHRIVHACLKQRPRDTEARLHVAALAAGDPAPAKALLDEVLHDVPDAEWFVGSFGPVMLVHVGPGLSGLAWWWEAAQPA